MFRDLLVFKEIWIPNIDPSWGLVNLYHLKFKLLSKQVLKIWTSSSWTLATRKFGKFAPKKSLNLRDPQFTTPKLDFKRGRMHFGWSSISAKRKNTHLFGNLAAFGRSNSAFGRSNSSSELPQLPVSTLCRPSATPIRHFGHDFLPPHRSPRYVWHKTQMIHDRIQEAKTGKQASVYFHSETFSPQPIASPKWTQKLHVFLDTDVQAIELSNSCKVLHAVVP